VWNLSAWIVQMVLSSPRIDLGAQRNN
jgi:hypothetical protein